MRRSGTAFEPAAFARGRSSAASRAPRVAAVEVAFPEHEYEQHELLASLERRWRDRKDDLALLARLHASVQVRRRRLALPLEAYDRLDGFGAANDAFIRVGTELGARAIDGAARRAGIGLRDIDAVFFTTVTGVAAPTIDARLVNRLGLRRDVRRAPMFGLGCVGGAAGLARARDHLLGHPDHVAVLLSVELCSLTLQDDFSVPNLVATGLFGDGAAAVILAGAARPSAASDERRPHARIVDTSSAFFHDTERVMGWDIGATGFKVVLSAGVPALVKKHLPGEVDALLARNGLSRRDVAHWICHPGGPKVIAAIEESLDLHPRALDVTRASLASVGNLSSASVLHVLQKTLDAASDGDVGLLMAMGPGFCAELVLLRWSGDDR